MIVSLNEVQAMATKAASGCGLAWGIAEEAGLATRWLCARGFRGADKMLHALEQHQACQLRIEVEASSLAIIADVDPVPI